MTPAEGLVLGLAAALFVAVFVAETKGTLDRWLGLLLLILAMMAAVAAFAHMVAR